MSIPLRREELAAVAFDLRTGRCDPGDYVETCCNRIDEVDPDLRSFVHEPDRRERVREAITALRDRFSGPESHPGADAHPASHPDTDTHPESGPDTDSRPEHGPRTNSATDSKPSGKIAADNEVGSRPPLYGVPVGVKDIMHVDGLTTRAGSALPPELIAGPEAKCIERLRSAGAIVLGKTVTTEFAGQAPGLTRNPHDLGHTPGGSSSGSAAAVAAGLCPLALGTQTIGSVIRPAAYCGVVGFKPSYGRVPRDGVIERSTSADHVGLFTQDVAGIDLAASILCDDWNPDDEPPHDLPTIGVPNDTYLEHATTRALESFESHVSSLERAGCTVERVHVPTFDEFESLARRHRRLARAELASVHDEWFEEYERFYRTPMAAAITDGRTVSDETVAAGRESQLNLREELADVSETKGVDVLAAPAATGPAPETIRTTGDPVMNLPWTHAGVPVITLPARTLDGLPLGIQFATSFGTDERLLSWARTLEEKR